MNDFFRLYGTKLWNAIGIHLVYVLVSVSIGFIIALALGILLSRLPRISRYVLPIISVVQTIPGIVFIGILFPEWCPLLYLLHSPFMPFSPC